jgi:phosphoserine phosphatase
VDGQFTGQVCGLPSFKEGKVTRLKQWLEARGESLDSFEASWFYSDSHNDMPLMKLVDHPVAVDADPQLTQYAEAHDWPRISLR